MGSSKGAVCCSGAASSHEETSATSAECPVGFTKQWDMGAYKETSNRFMPSAAIGLLLGAVLTGMIMFVLVKLHRRGWAHSTVPQTPPIDEGLSDFLAA